MIYLIWKWMDINLLTNQEIKKFQIVLNAEKTAQLLEVVFQ